MKFEVLLSPPDVGELEQEYVLAAMRSGWVAPAGPDLGAFEREVAAYCGVPYAVALASGTAALHLALVSWNIGPGDVVVTSTLTFAATANAIRYVGAQPWFVDCDLDNGNLDPTLLEEALQEIHRLGKRIGAILPVDLLGKCCNYTAIEAIARKYDVPLLCDSAESMGASHAGRPSGSFGQASALSFNGNKVMTTSGGGMLLTHSRDVAEHVRYLSTQARQPVAHYEHTDVGYNYRLSNVLAALGRAQLSRLGEMISQRREWRSRYREVFANTPGIRILGGTADDEDNCWLTAIVVDEDITGWEATKLAGALQTSGIETRPVWKPMHLQPVYRDWPGTLNGSSDRLFARGLTLPSGSGMTDAQFAMVIKSLHDSGWIR